MFTCFLICLLWQIQAFSHFSIKNQLRLYRLLQAHAWGTTFQVTKVKKCTTMRLEMTPLFLSSNEQNTPHAHFSDQWWGGVISSS